MIKVGIAGCMGRMGQHLIDQVAHHPDLHFSAGLVAHNSEWVGKEIAPGVHATTDMDSFFASSDVIIDFTCPDASLESIKLAGVHKKPIIVGTSGLGEEHEQEALQSAKTSALILAPNTSLTVNVMLALAEKMASILGEEFDVEIEETHHRLKVDAPSGTAFAIGRSVAQGRNVDLDEKAIFDRHHANQARKPGEIGFTAMRGGQIAGEHMLHFHGDGESLSLNSRVFDRAIFAKGAIKAAHWLTQQKPGLYTMANVLGV